MKTNFNLVVVTDYEAMSKAAADIIAAQIIKKPDSVLGLATGSTPVGTYRQLVEMHGAGKLDFSKITSFNLDEYHPISRNNDQSYNYFMQINLFDHVNANPENVHLPDGECADVNAECAGYEAKINGVGLDLQLLGLGHNGHIGFNEPSDSFAKITHYTPLTQSTIIANSPYFSNPDDMPRHAITMGIGTIFQAKHILMLVSGAAKADIVARVFQGDITPQVPGSILQLHPNITLIADKQAAEKLSFTKNNSITK